MVRRMSRVPRRKKLSSVRRYWKEGTAFVAVNALQGVLGLSAWWFTLPIGALVAGRALWPSPPLSDVRAKWTALVHDLVVPARRTQAVDALLAMLHDGVGDALAMKVIVALAEAGFDQHVERELDRHRGGDLAMRAYAISLVDVRAERSGHARAELGAGGLGGYPGAANALVLVAEGKLAEAEFTLRAIGPLPTETAPIAGVEPPHALLPLRIRAIHADLALARGERGKAFALLQAVEPYGLAWLAYHPGPSREIAADLVSRRGAFR
jgi:hypothetical protein